jgi:hypothetical protein
MMLHACLIQNAIVLRTDVAREHAEIRMYVDVYCVCATHADLFMYLYRLFLHCHVFVHTEISTCEAMVIR